MRERHLCRICCLLLLWFACGSVFREPASAPALPVTEGQTVTVTGTVCRQDFRSSGQRIYLQDISFTIPAAQSPHNRLNWKKQQMLVWLKEPQSLRLGCRVRLRGICEYPDAQRNPGEFDARAYYRSLQVGMFLKKAVVLQKDRSCYPLREALSSLRLFCRRRLQLAGEDTDAGLLSAMLLGDKDILDEQTEELYQQAGIVHLLAISGLHVSLTGMALFAFMRRLGCSFAVTGFFSGLLMAAYACMTGYPLSAVRAVLMFGLFLLSQVCGRTYDLPTALAAAAIALLLGRQGVLTQAGFWLSFGAVIGVILSAGWKSRLLRETSLGVSLAVQLITLPLVAFYYYQFPLYGVLLNLCVLWMMPFVLGLGLAGLAAAAVSLPAGKLLLAPAHYLLYAIELLCRAVRLLPGATVTTGKPQILKIAAYYAVLASFFYLLEKSAKWRQTRSNCGKIEKIDLIKLAIALILLTGTLSADRAGDVCRFTFLDVGQGDGCCIENGNRSVWMIDGGSSSRTDLAQYCLEPFLYSRGHQRVDYWLVSHGDADHVSGLLDTLRVYQRRLDGQNANGLTIGMILLPDAQASSAANQEIEQLAARQGIPVRYLRQGDCVREGGLSVRVLAPRQGGVYGDANEASLVAQVSCYAFEALFTGDIGEEGEAALLEQKALQDVDVLKAAHHGSGYSSTAAFLQAVRPELTVISCGEHNRYGHPHEDALARLRAAGSRLARTDRQGAIEILVTKSGYTASSWLG